MLIGTSTVMLWSILFVSMTAIPWVRTGVLFSGFPVQGITDQNVTVPARSRIECAILCKKWYSCSLFAFDALGKTCRLQPTFTLGNGNSTLRLHGQLIESCEGVKLFDNSSGVHTLRLRLKTIPVFCDQSTDNGGWTVIQRRQNGKENFFRNWTDYEMGFGNLMAEFWIGLDTLYAFTNNRNYKLRVDLADFNGNTVYALYNTFYISNASDNYRLTAGGYSGTAGDSLTFHSGMQYSTADSDNDDAIIANCALNSYGAWWYRACFWSNLNGRYQGVINQDGITWNQWMNNLKSVEMKIRP